MAKGILLRLVDGVTPLANLSGLICLWWDQTDVYEFETPIGRTNQAFTDSNGYLKLDISNVSGLAIGNYGFLVVYKEETDANYKKAPVFASIVEVKNCEGGTQLVYSAEEYVRPADWISLGTLPTETDNKFLGLHAVWKDGPNWCTLKFTCSDSSQYTVDWGDGTSTENIDSGTTAYHSFNYTNLDADTETGISEVRSVTFQDTGDTVTLSNHGFDNGTEISFSSIVTTTGISTYTRYYVVNISGSTFQVSDTKGGTAKTLTNDGTGAVYLPGYRQSLVTVIPTTTGKAFTALDLNIRHTSASAVVYSTGWLDICLSAPSMTSLTIGLSTNNVHQGMLETFNAVSNGVITDFSYMFYECYFIQFVSLDTSSGTNFYSMFENCHTLKSIPLLDTSSGTNFSEMFYGCNSLSSIPLLDTSSGTNFSSMFENCKNLKSIPLIDTSSGTNFLFMFSNCYSLQSIPLINTSSGTDFQYMFSNCYSLQSIPLIDTSSGTNFYTMFGSCYTLKSIPLLDTSNGTNFGWMFSECLALQSIPLLDTSNGTGMYCIFYSCEFFESIPLLDTSSGTSFNKMFYYCYSLKSVPFLNTSNGTDFSEMFSAACYINSIPLLDTSSGTNFSSMFDACRSLQIGTLLGTSTSISYASCNLSSDALNEIFENLAVPRTNPCSITITTNWGAAKVSLSGITTSGSTSVTMANTTGLSANMWITGTGISDSRSISFQDSGNTITLSSHGIPNGTRVGFSAITYTAGIETNKIYYVVNTDTNTFQVSDTIGGSAKELTNDGVGVLLYETYIVSVIPNTSITLSIPASSSATNTLVSTTLNPYLATLKGWTVVN